MGEFMKWYKAYADLVGHPKRYKLEAELNTIHGLHYIHCWFAYVAKYAEDGDVTNFNHKEIARACEWTGDAETFFNALSVSGFIDQIKGGNGGFRLIAHDWFEENARFLKENEKRKPLGNPRKTHGKPLLQDSTVQDSTRAYSDIFYQAYKARFGQDPSPPKTTFINLAALVKKGVSLEHFKQRVDAYFVAKWPESKDFQGLLTHWDKFAVAIPQPKKLKVQI